MDRALVNVEDLAAAIDEAHVPAYEGEGRVRLEEIEVARTRVDLRAGVALSMEGAVHRGEGRAQGAGREALSAVVEATLDALRSVVGTGVVVEEVDVVSCGEERVAAVVLSWGGRRLAGSALVSSDDAGALCRATLQALNRAVGA